MLYEEKCPLCGSECPDTYHIPVPEHECVLNKPMLICIPPEGMHISCPVHHKGHHLVGTRVSL